MQDEEELAYYAYARSLAHVHDGSQDGEKLAYYAYAHSLAHTRGG